MTGFEEEAVERKQNCPNTAALCNELLARCLVPPGADHALALDRIRGLLVAERDAALVRLRQISLGDTVHTVVTCPACGQQSEVDFQLSSLPLDLPDVPATLDISVGEGPAQVRMPSAGDQEALLDEPLETKAEKRTWLLARVLLRLGEEDGPFEPAFVRSVPTRTRLALEDALESALPDLDLGMQITCHECEHLFSSAFEVAAFFLPR